MKSCAPRVDDFQLRGHQIIQNLGVGILAELAVGEGDSRGEAATWLHGCTARQFSPRWMNLRDQISGL